MLPSGINKIIQEYCYYKPEYLSDLEWWKPETINNWLAEFFEERPSSFLFCDNKCRKSIIKYGISEVDLCSECTDDLYSTYICFYINRVCCICGIKEDNSLSIYHCHVCDKHYCRSCYDKFVSNSGEYNEFELEPSCKKCLEKINNNTSFLIESYPCILPEERFIIHFKGRFQK